MGKIMIGRFVILFVILISYQQLKSQSSLNEKLSKQKPFLSFGYHGGRILKTNDFVNGKNSEQIRLDNYKSYSVKIGFQNPGYTNWQKTFHIPYYGMGFKYSNFDFKDLGSQKALYGFFGIPILRYKNFELYNELQFGFGWNQIHYDSINNPKNIAIGSLLTVFVDIGFNAVYHLNRNIDIGGGVSFSHYSNGGFERPNRGLNLFAPFVEIKYHFKERADTKDIPQAIKEQRSNDLYFMLGYGNHQIVEHEFDTNYYSVMGLGIYYDIQHNNYFRSGMGVDFNYLRALSANSDGTPGVQGTLDNLTIGIIYAPELMISRLSIIAGIGIYAKHHKYGNFQQLYQRAGVKYHFTENFSAGINVRSINFMLAEFLEFNIGYRIRWEK